MATAKKCTDQIDLPYCELTLTGREQRVLMKLLGAHSDQSLREFSERHSIDWGQKDICSVAKIWDALNDLGRIIE